MKNEISIKKQIEAYLDDCLALEGVFGCAVVSRTGALMGKKFEQDVSAPSFAAMSATILGSAEAAAGLVHIPPPASVFVDVEGGGILVMGAGERALITVIINKSADIQSLIRELAVIASKIGEK